MHTLTKHEHWWWIRVWLRDAFNLLTGHTHDSLAARFEVANWPAAMACVCGGTMRTLRCSSYHRRDTAKWPRCKWPRGLSLNECLFCGNTKAFLPRTLLQAKTKAKDSGDKAKNKNFVIKPKAIAVCPWGDSRMGQLLEDTSLVMVRARYSITCYTLHSKKQVCWLVFSFTWALTCL